MIGQKLRDRYLILEPLGNGAFGDTYLARDTDMADEHLCVVKHLQPKLGNLNQFWLDKCRYYFLNEGKVLQELGEHPQIPRLLGYFEEKNEFYIVQEYIKGHDLSEEIRLNQPLGEEKATTLLREILEVLVEIQQHNIIHRDLKPDNLIRRHSDNKICVIDFGIVKKILMSTSNSGGNNNVNLNLAKNQTVTAGTHGYMDKDQLNGHPTTASDIYAVGMIVIQSLTGILPINFQNNGGQIIWQDRVKISDKLARILTKMSQSLPNSRYQLASEVLEDLQGKNLKRKPNNIIVLVSSGLVVLGIAAAVAVNLVSNSSSQLKSYQSKQPINLTLQYPNDWEKFEATATGDLVKFISPFKDSKDNYREEFKITVEPLDDKKISLQEYSENTVQQISANLTETEITSTPFAISQLEARKVVYIQDKVNKNLKTMLVFTIKTGKVYICNYTANIDTFDRYVQTIETMLASMKID
jgi:eukaryotic-like serine/threonine-protein kinase